MAELQEKMSKDTKLAIENRQALCGKVMVKKSISKSGKPQVLGPQITKYQLSLQISDMVNIFPNKTSNNYCGPSILTIAHVCLLPVN